MRLVKNINNLFINNRVKEKTKHGSFNRKHTFKYNLKPNDLNIDNIILLSEDDLKVILNEIGHANIDKEIKSFKRNKDIINFIKKLLVIQNLKINLPNIKKQKNN